MVIRYLAVYLCMLCTLFLILFGTSNAKAQFIYNPDNGHYYGIRLLKDSFSWRDAYSEAEAQTFMGVTGHLGTITSAEELRFIMAHVLPPAPTSEIWVGGKHFGNTWGWVTGEPFDLPRDINIAPDVFLEAGALVMLQDGSWQVRDQVSSAPTAYLIEFDPTPIDVPEPLPMPWLLPIDDPIQIVKPLPLPIPVPEPIQLCSQLISTQGDYVDGDLELTFHLNSDVAVTWDVWLIVRNEIKSLLSVYFPDGAQNALLFPFTLPAFPPSGSVGILTTLTTPTNGIYCSNFTTIDTGLNYSMP